MDYFWITVRAIEDLAVCLLLFAILTAYSVGWKNKKLAYAVQALFCMLVVGAGVYVWLMMGRLQSWVVPRYTEMKILLVIVLILHCIGYSALWRLGWRVGKGKAVPAATAWPKTRLLIAFLVALTLDVITHWNITLTVHQRLAQMEIDSRFRALSVMPGRPIDSENAAYVYDPVLDKFRDHKLIEWNKDWLDFSKSFDSEDPALLEILARYRQDIDTLVKGSNMPQWYFGMNLFQWEFPEFAPILSAFKLLVIDARHRSSIGDLDNALEKVSALFRVSHQLNQTPILKSVLVSVAIEQQAISCLQEILNHPSLSSQVLDSFQVDTHQNFNQQISRALSFEEAFGTSHAKELSQRGVEPWINLKRKGLHVAISSVLWNFTNVYFIEHELQVFRSTHLQYRHRLNQANSKVAAQHAIFGDQIQIDGILNHLLFPSLDLVVHKARLAEIHLQQVPLAIAMRRYELEHSTFPGSPDDLVPGYIEAIPQDPFTLEPMRTVNVDGGVRIYSEGTEALDPEKFPRNRLDVKVEIILTNR